MYMLIEAAILTLREICPRRVNITGLLQNELI